MSYEEQDSIQKIDEHVYLTNWRGASCIEKLQRLNINDVISVVEHNPPTELVKAKKRILHLRLYDDEHQKIFPELLAAHEFIMDCKRANRSVLVHCLMGISRSTSVIIAHLMLAYPRITYEEALGKVCKMRPIANPNPGFSTQLMLTRSNYEMHKATLGYLKYMYVVVEQEEEDI